MACKIHFVPVLLAVEVAFCACSLGQHAQLPSNLSQAKTAPAHQSKPSPSVPVAPTPPVPVLGQPAGPATVTLTSGELSIKANNSSLSDILNQIANVGGMKIEGLSAGANADQRIFGSYGPGQPREVLSQLLDGCGFNVIMLGRTPAGTPKTLSLSARAPGGPTNPPPQSATSQYQNYRENYMSPQTDYPQPENDSASPTTQYPRVRTPQEVLQQLEQMRGRQQQPN